MPRFAANLTMLFNEVAFLDRFGEAAEAGFRGVEFLAPYAFQAKEVADPGVEPTREDVWATVVLHGPVAPPSTDATRYVAAAPSARVVSAKLLELVVPMPVNVVV